MMELITEQNYVVTYNVITVLLLLFTICHPITTATDAAFSYYLTGH